jgi:hypothetical protein
LKSAWAERFGRLGEIDPERPQTWEGRLFLTLDLDWAADPVIAHCLDLVEEAGVAATVFVNHDTPLLARMRANSRIELGLYPNFNPLLEGNGGGSAEKVMRELQQIVPEARIVRSHAITQSSRLLDLFLRFGMTHDSNQFVPAHSGIVLRPYRHWKGGLVRVPYCWEDDVHLEYGSPLPVLEVAAGSGLKVFDFHPIHVALNTESMAHYEATRALHRDWQALRTCASHSPKGVHSLFRALLFGKEQR